MAARIMLLGAGGQIGQALQAQPLPAGWELIALTRAQCDIVDRYALQQQIQTRKPDLIINAAAMTAVDLCEKDQDAAVFANFEAPAHLAAQCSVDEIPLLHLSTDYVFDGKDGATPYQVDDPMGPVNVYGNTKMMGEESIRHELAWHVILRVSSVFSAYGANILTKTLDAIETRDELKSVTDQMAAPTYAPDIAAALITMTAAIMQGKVDGFGTFHLCGTPAANRHEFVQAVMAAYAPYTSKRPQLIPALTADFPGFAARPAYSVLDCARIKSAYSIEQQPWRDGLAQAIAQLKQQRNWSVA